MRLIKMMAEDNLSIIFEQNHEDIDDEATFLVHQDNKNIIQQELEERGRGDGDSNSSESETNFEKLGKHEDLEEKLDLKIQFSNDCVDAVIISDGDSDNKNQDFDIIVNDSGNHDKVYEATATNIRLAACADIQDIVNDFQAAATIDDGLSVDMTDEVDSSLSPRAPLASEIPIIILEAPEPFRCVEQQVEDEQSWNRNSDGQVDVVPNRQPEGRHREAPHRDHDNTYKAETGDTFRRTTDKDKCCYNNNTTTAASVATNDDYYGNLKEKCSRVVGGNDNNVEWHVGSASPPHTTVEYQYGQSQSQQQQQYETQMVNDSGSVGMLLVDGENNNGTSSVKSKEFQCDDDESESGPCLCAADLHQPPESEPSIDKGVAECAQASGCSRVSTAEVCVALNPDPSNSCTKFTTTTKQQNHSDQNGTDHQINFECNIINKPSVNLSWSFKNGRLVFDESENSRTTKTEQVVENDQSDNDDSIITILHSKDLNKKIDENRSRLRYLEQKLKQAGITDEEPIVVKRSCEDEEQVVDKSTLYVDDNQNILKTSTPPISHRNHQDQEEQEQVLLCEFDVRKVDVFSELNTNYIQVYDELNNDDDDDDETSNKHSINMRDNANSGGSSSMGVDGERSSNKHNPDRDNLKSLLKRPGKSKDKRSNRVVFNENKNEFFDADYIILIREECDYDDEEDDGVCTCNQHEMVRLTCCEPNCNCSVYDGGYDQQTPQSPKFAPPLEFVDAVTLSPPEGYKDMELGEQQLLALQQMARRTQRAAVCRECSATHEDEDDDGEGSQQGSDNEASYDVNNSDHEEQEEKEKTDQSQQTTPTTPPNDSDSPNSQRYILETITMTTVTEQRILREAEEEKKTPNTAVVVPSGGSPINGILKGGRLWKQQSLDVNATKPPEPQQQNTTDLSITSDEETNNRRSVRFIESEQDKRDVCDGASDNPPEEDEKQQQQQQQEKPTSNNNEQQQIKSLGSGTDINNGGSCNNSSSVSPESTEMMLTFKLGNHVLISNNSLKPNSAVRQLFPCTKPMIASGGSGVKEDNESIHQYLVTAESLRAFEEAKRSKLPQIIQSGETDESIKRAIERNTLRRSLIRYEPRSRKNIQKTDNSLVERIKQLTCDVDDNPQPSPDDIPPRASPPGEEARNSPEVIHHHHLINKNHDKSFSPSSSSTASSNSSSMSSTYKKITDLFGKRAEKVAETQTNNDIMNNTNNKLNPTMPDLGNGGNHIHELGDHCPVTKINSTTNNESRKQFLSTLAPLTACVSGIAAGDEYFYHMNNHIGERASVASSVGTEYSLEDIDEGLKNSEEESKKIAPDVLAGTPSASESGDELAMFVQQDASRIERIKKKYQPEQSNKDEDDEHDDYGFNRRPSVRGIKPRFGSTTEILQQIQSQLQPPPTQTARVNWPYYSESGLTTTTTGVDNTNKTRNINQNLPTTNYQYPPNVPEEIKPRNLPSQYRPTSLQDENMYQNCSNQRCMREVYRANVNQTYSTVMKVGGACTEYYQSMPRLRNGRPQSPPPLELSKNYHQTMVYIPYNHLEGYQANPYYQSDYVRVTNQNQINKRYIEPIYQQRINPHVEEHHYSMLPPMPPPKQLIRPTYSQHLVSSRSESPLPGQFSTARSTQTPIATPSTCNYYSTTPRYRPIIGPIWSNEGNYVTKLNRHSFPTGNPRYPTAADNISLTDSESQHSGQIPNGYRQSVELYSSHNQKDSIPNSPTKPRFIERGVPEGAASVSQQDSTSLPPQSSSSTMTSPTSPQNPVVSSTATSVVPTQTGQKPLFYAMNV